MAKINISEETIRKITEKYVKSVRRGPTNKADIQPDIKKVVTEAIRSVSPDKQADEAAISAVMEELSKRPIINDKIINEVAKKVVDHNAYEDMVFSIKTYAKQVAKTATEADVEAIIKKSKLDPYASTPFQIKNAVRNYFEGERPVGNIPHDEIRDVIKTELAKGGPIDDRDVTAVLQKYLRDADPEKPLKPEDIKTVIRQHVDDKPKTNRPDALKPEPIQVSTGPQPTPLQRPQTPQDEPEAPTGATPPPPRTGRMEPPVNAGNPVPPKDKKNLTFFEKIRQKMARYGIPALTNFSRNWLKDNVYKATSSPNRRKLLTQGQSLQEALIGKMFLYFYDAKMKEELPYWDKFPLILCVDVAEDGWYGLNLHYLPLPLRIKLFESLLTLADNQQLDKVDRLRMSYKVLKGFSQFPEAKPCFKRYLASYVQSDLLEIEPVDWETAVFLPVEMFQKQPKEKVWKESRSNVRNFTKKSKTTPAQAKYPRTTRPRKGR